MLAHRVTLNSIDDFAAKLSLTCVDYLHVEARAMPIAATATIPDELPGESNRQMDRTRRGLRSQ
jgi:hypothetical protein